MNQYIKSIHVTGKFVKIGSIVDSYVDINKYISEITGAYNHNVDILTFSQNISQPEPQYKFYYEMDNYAAIPISSYENWWKTQIRDKTRNMVRKSQKKGVEVRGVQFDDELVAGISDIYNETPIRQGKPFWHYNKDFHIVKSENATFPKSSYFLGAYFQGELIGFAKIVINDNVATFMQILSKISHRDKAPTNALIAAAVEYCSDNNISFLVYSKFYYGKKGPDPLNEFKQHNGFMKIDVPKYYIPLTTTGVIALKFGLHRSIVEILPRQIINILHKYRAKWHTIKYS